MPKDPDRELRVFVASSLASVFQELADTMQARDTALVVRLNAGGSPSLVSQMEFGAACDLLITADERWMRQAQDKQLVGPARIFAGSSLALVVSTRPEVASYLREPLNLASPGVKVVLAAPEVPLGRYSRQLLQQLSGITGYGRDFAARVELGVVSQELSAAGVLSKLRLGEADAGIIYRAQLVQDSSGTIREMPVPGARQLAARYFIARASQAADTADASRLTDLLLSPVGRGILERNGFEVTPDSAASAP